jgi:predicted lipoprotein with Yx(FWY)xxD motif
MKTSNLIWVGVVLIIIAGGWYYMSMSGVGGPQNQTINVAQNTTPTLKVSADPQLGNFLVASNGMTLYLYTKDALDVSNCYGDCAVKWPPYSPATNSPFTPGVGVTGRLSTIARTDGTTQLAYNGIPLYYWYLDVKPGDTLGQNVGGVWFVVKP